jgi:hypothetical protein
MIDNIRAVLQNMALDKPGLWGQPVWYFVLAALYAGCLVALFVLLWRTSDRTRLIKRIGIMLVVISAVRAAIYVGLDYPWQVPDEHGHYEYVALTARLKRVPTFADLDPVLEQDILQSMHVYRWWELGYNRPQPATIPFSFADDPDLKISWLQVGDEPFLYYALLSPVHQLFADRPLIDILYILRLVSALLLPLTVWVIFLCLAEVFPENAFLILGGTAFVTLNPMFAFVNSGVSNNIFSALTATLLLWSVHRVCKYGMNWRRGALLIALTAVTVLSRKSNLFLVLWTMLVFAWYGWQPVWRWIHRRGRLTALGASILSVTILALMAWPSQDAANWIQFPWPEAPTRTLIDPATSAYALSIRDDSIGTTRQLVQDVIQPIDTSNSPLLVRVQARSDVPDQPLRLQLFDGINTSVITTTVGTAWTTVQLTHQPGAGAWRLRVLIAADSGLASDTGTLLVRNAELLDSASQRNLLDNGSGEQPSSQLTRLINLLMMRFGISGDWFTFLRNPHLFDQESIQWYGHGFQTLFEWFWGRFAYIALPLAVKWYQVLLVVTIIALAGLVRLAIWNWRKTRSGWGRMAVERRRVIGFWMLALLLNLGSVLFPMFRETRLWLPQGRYLYPSILPIAMLFTAGWQSWIPTRWQRRGGLAAFIGGWVVLDALVILFYIVPHYYGHIM